MTVARFAPFAIVGFALVLGACESHAEREADAVEDRIEQSAQASAAAAGDAIAAIGMTERQLLDADLVTADGTELGDVEQLRRDESGAVTGLLVEIEDSDPDRYVVVPLDGLTAADSGRRGDVQTTMTARELAALPEAQLGAAASPVI
jgi:hypothetical protein